MRTSTQPKADLQDILDEIRRDLSRADTNRLEYTRKAFRMIPQLTRPRILDVGCGPGGPTLGLARLSEGEIIGRAHSLSRPGRNLYAGQKVSRQRI